MATVDRSQTAIIKRIDGLTPDMIQEVVDFIDFLKLKKMEEISNSRDLLSLQQESISRIWDSDSEDLYEI